MRATRRKRQRTVVVVGASAVLVACEVLFPTVVSAPLDGGSDAGAVEASLEAPEGPSNDAATVYHDMTNASYWSTEDLSSLGVGASYSGAGFDGRYLYLVPAYSGNVARYDTTLAWDATASWGTFNTTALGANVQQFAGAAFDHRFVYLVPSLTSVGRYDTALGFSDAGSWSSFDTTMVSSNQGFAGAAFDGRYVYLVPFHNVSVGSSNSIVNRFDTTSSFTSAASWAVFDTTSIDPAAKEFFGSAFDGRYVYLAPALTTRAVQYDTKAPFDAGTSWSSFNLSLVSSKPGGYFGAAFDGRFVYLVPFQSGGSYNGIVSQYDATKPFTAPSSWASFDTTTLNPAAKAFAGAAFDGRFVYFVPDSLGSPSDAVIARYDTAGPIGSASSWSTFDLNTVDKAATSRFRGAAFDGRYVYLVPLGANILVRFDAKTPPSMPQGYSGSFL